MASLQAPSASELTTATSQPPAPRRKRTLRRLLRDASTVLIISGLLLLADAVTTLLWQEPVTAVIALIQRGEISGRYLHQQLTPVELRALASIEGTPGRIAFLAREMQRRVTTGAAIGQLVMPRLGSRWEVVQGTSDQALERGPGHYPDTAFPGMGQTVGIAGHRTTYLAPFRNLNEFRPGDRIYLDMPYAHFTYVVQYSRVVAPNSVWVVNNVGYERLVLSACNPLYSASQRIVVFARLRSEVPTAEARVPASLLRARPQLSGSRGG